MSIPYEKPLILEKPKRCRKCGKAAVGFQLSTNPAYPIWVYVCSAADCDESTDYYGTQAEAIAAWNRRADGPPNTRTVLRIRQFLGERCLTQTEGAKRCGLTVQAFSRIVNGKEPPYRKRGKRIADALGWPVDRWEELFEKVVVDD